GPGGWAWAVPDGPFASGAAPDTTNQRMELQAAHEAVQAIDGALEVVSDSTYVVNCFRDRWYEGWHRRGWKNSKKEPVANRDLWEPFIDLVLGRGDVTFRWVKGHSDDPMNDLVDRLAVEAAATQEGRTGVGEPEDLGPPDVVSSRAGGRDRRLPDGRLVLVAGHRPGELGGYGDNAIADGVRTRLGELLVGLVEVDGPLHVVSGLRLGAEQLGAEAALAEGLPLVAVLPYPEPDSPWPPASRARFAETLAGAAATITLDRKVPASKQAAGIALGKRDDWLARQVDAAVVVWDQEDAAIGRLVRSLEDRLGPEQVLLVHP
ncbi:MAG: RNase H family protein, partial [Acidimicrobiales bacterium]